LNRFTAIGFLTHMIGDSLRRYRAASYDRRAAATSEGHMPSVPRSQDASRATTHEIQVVTPYRLDLTVSALRRMSTNLVDVYTPDGRYLRALGGFAEPVILSVTQPRADTLAVSVRGSAGDTERALVSVRRVLGTDLDLSESERHARAIPWLAPLARRMRGLKPPRYPTLFEACANAIVFQQLRQGLRGMRSLRRQSGCHDAAGARSGARAHLTVGASPSTDLAARL
jgi:hypothetical protein